MHTLPKFQFITHFGEDFTYIDAAKKALDAGFKWIQYRHKPPVSETVLKEEAVAIRQLCKQYQALFTINDHPWLAKELEADGVHLGKTDTDPEKAALFLGKDCIIGGTSNTFQDILRLYQKGVRYVGLGPYRFTSTKSNLSQILGLEGYREIRRQCREHSISIPVYAIGGIDLPDLEPLKDWVDGIAVSSCFLQAPDGLKWMEEAEKRFGIY